MVPSGIIGYTILNPTSIEIVWPPYIVGKYKLGAAVSPSFVKMAAGSGLTATKPVAFEVFIVTNSFAIMLTETSLENKFYDY